MLLDVWRWKKKVSTLSIFLFQVFFFWVQYYKSKMYFQVWILLLTSFEGLFLNSCNDSFSWHQDIVSNVSLFLLYFCFASMEYYSSFRSASFLHGRKLFVCCKKNILISQVYMFSLDLIIIQVRHGLLNLFPVLAWLSGL